MWIIIKAARPAFVKARFRSRRRRGCRRFIFRYGLPAKYYVESRSGRDDLRVEVDRGKIATALSNLVKNAIMFTDENGHVFVTGELVPGYVKVSVIDDGIGIPAKDLPYIFDRFFQVESHLTRRHGGMGLGLSVAKAMVEIHGGRIWAESMEGKGSNFTFLLPVDPAQAEAGSRVFSP